MLIAKGTGKRMDYYEYLKSPKWKQIRDAAIARAGYRCQVCNRPNGQVILDVHHRTYERLGNENPDDLTVLCRDCHRLFTENGKLAPVPRTKPQLLANQSVRHDGNVAGSDGSWIVYLTAIVALVLLVLMFRDIGNTTTEPFSTPTGGVHAVAETPKTQPTRSVKAVSIPDSLDDAIAPVLTEEYENYLQGAKEDYEQYVERSKIEAEEWRRDAEMLGLHTPSPATSPMGCQDGCTVYPDWCAPPIKGNIQYDTGERIYHVPGQEYYNDTKINPRYGEVWFCTESEARAAGWRRSYR